MWDGRIETRDLILANCIWTMTRSATIYGMWKNNILLFGQYVDDERKFKVFLGSRSDFSYLTLNVCSICQKDIKSESYCILNCHHIYCHDHIREWLLHNPTCPLCRELVSNGIKSKIINNRDLYFV